MLGRRRSKLSRPKRTPLQRPHQHLIIGSEDDDASHYDGDSGIPLFYVPNNKYICYFDSSKSSSNNNANKGIRVYDNLKNNSDVTSATSLTTVFSYELSSELDDDESISLQSSSNVQQLVPTTTTTTTMSKSLAQIAAEKIKEGRYSCRVEECNQSKSSKSTVTTKSLSTTSSSSSPSAYTKLPSTVLKYMFKCDGGKVGESTVSNEDTPHGVATTKSRDTTSTTTTTTTTTTIQEPSDAGSISSTTVISTTSSRLSRRSKKYQSRRNQIPAATGLKSTVAATTVATSSSAAASPKDQHMKMIKNQKTKKPITIVASSLGRGGGYMIPIDEMNDMCPFDEESGVELQLVEDHEYYLSKITNEIKEHQRRVERELRKSRRALHHRSDNLSSQSNNSGTSRSVEITRTPSEADF